MSNRPPSNKAAEADGRKRWRNRSVVLDGTVSVSRTHLAGMKDHLVVPHTHTFIMNSTRVAREIIHFLRHGLFEHGGEDAV